MKDDQTKLPEEIDWFTVACDICIGAAIVAVTGVAWYWLFTKMATQIGL